MQHASQSDLVDALLRSSRSLVGVAARSLADVDVTLPQFRALVLLSSRDRTTVSELAEALQIHQTSATRLCDRLVRKRLIRRTEAAADRRETELVLAPAGTRLVDRVTARRRAHLATIAAEMSIEDVAATVAALDAFTAAAGDRVDADLFGWTGRTP